jgi:tetratricopeptide (TPR) repeat protein
MVGARRAVTGATLVVPALLYAAATASLLDAQTPDADRSAVAEAQRLFYSGQYSAAAAMALALRSSDPDNLETYEIRTSALHFQIKRALGNMTNGSKALPRCATCPSLMSDFFSDITRGQTIARARLKTNPRDEAALFFLGKIDLNYIWIQLGTLSRRTGWNEYWEARRSLDVVLKQNPDHVRARVARAWMDYIVDTKVPWGTKWMLGGGNKKQALRIVADAARAESDFFIQAEAGFALWEMQVRERSFTDAIVTARGLARDFPDNQDLVRFLEAQSQLGP